MLIETFLIQRFLSGIDRSWIDLLQGRQITPEEAEKLTSDYDIDSGSYDYSTMIARIGMLNGFRNFRSDLISRLKGLISYQKTRRALNHAHYQKLIDVLQQNKMEYTAGYYLSMDARYCKNDWRAKYMFDLLVHSSDAEKVQQLTQNDEKTFKTLIQAEESSFVWSNSDMTVFCGREIRTLSPNAMVIEYAKMVCENLHAVVLKQKDQKFERFRWLYDYKLIDSEDEGIDPAVLAEYCKEKDIRIYHTVRFLLSCAYTFYEEKEKLEKLQLVMPKGKKYLLFLFGLV